MIPSKIMTSWFAAESVFLSQLYHIQITISHYEDRSSVSVSHVNALGL